MKKLVLIALALTAPLYAQTPTTKTMTEYVVSSFNYYFLTSRDNEKALLDANPAFRRTGYSFTVLASQVAGSVGLTRYYFDQIAKGGTRGSHFYTLVGAEVAALNALNPGNATTARLPQNEGIDSYAHPAAVDNPIKCDLDKEPVYRVFRGNARFPDDANHRFTSDRALYLQLLAEGWEDEGVKFCVGRTVTVPPSSGGGDTYRGTFEVRYAAGQGLNFLGRGSLVFRRNPSPTPPEGSTVAQLGNLEVYDAVEGSITISVNEPENCDTTSYQAGPITLPVNQARAHLVIAPSNRSNGIGYPQQSYALGAPFSGVVPTKITAVSCSPTRDVTSFVIDYTPLTLLTCENFPGGTYSRYTDPMRLAGTCTVPGIDASIAPIFTWDFTRE